MIVCEISSSTLQGVSPKSCGTDISGTGFVTTYTYTTETSDALQVTTVTQGAQTRVFKVDSLGRTVYTSEPEVGVTTYAYSYSGTAGLGLMVVRQKPQANQGNPSTLTKTTTQYDNNGGYVCQGSNQPSCTNGTQVYGFNASYAGTHVTNTCDTVLGICNSFSYDEFNRLSARTVTQGTVQNYTYNYDRYGNRWAQNAPQGGSTSSISFNQSNNIINTAGYANDAAGNVTNDSQYVYRFDADGNVISGGGATYAYDSLNHRVQIAPTRGTYEFVFDIFGRRISCWTTAPSQTLVSSNVYSDSGQPIAFRDGVQTQFAHQNWLGTERVRQATTGRW